MIPLLTRCKRRSLLASVRAPIVLRSRFLLVLFLLLSFEFPGGLPANQLRSFAWLSFLPKGRGSRRGLRRLVLPR